MGKRLNLALCGGRHDIPGATDGYIFGEIPQKYITDTVTLEDLAFAKLWGIARKNGLTRHVLDWRDGDEYDEEIVPGLQLNLYVTGLTVALISVLNVARNEGIKVVLYHFDRSSGEYFPQEVY